MSLRDILSQFAVLIYGPAGEKCEDACCYSFERDDLHHAAAFDGCGGLGSKRYELLGNKTGAFIASQTCATAFHHLAGSHKGSIDDAFIARLKAAFLDTLKKLEQQYGQQNALVGSMVRTLPCTGSMAIVTQDPQHGDALRLDIIQAGDSRVYVMRPKQGLQQVTRDELAGNPDALKNLYVSAPMTNVINIDKDFTLTHLSLTIKPPFAVLCASDGVFGYVKTPMHFERIILSALENAETFGDFERVFRTGVTSITGDDSTAVMPFYGWTAFDQLKEDFAKRYRYVDGLCTSVDTDARDEIIEAAWAQYSRDYYWQGVDR